MIRLIQSPWVAAIVGILTYCSTTFIMIRPQTLKQKLTKANQSERNPDLKMVPSWQFKNPELDLMLIDLRAEKEALATRAQQLNDLEARLISERQAISVITQTVYNLQKTLDQSVLRVKDEEAANLKKLAKVYGTMAPESSASILKEMQDEQIVGLLLFMKESETAPILESLGRGGKEDAKRAAVVSNRLRLATAHNPADKTKTP